MVRLREIPRTAAFAWSPDPSKPLLITGTRAGAVDADFSDETKLELWDLNLDNQDQGLELQPVASISTDSRFYDIAWGPPDSDHPRGIIAGALENGSLDLWDAEKLIEGSDDAHMSRTTKHTGAIKSLQFNPLRPQILATAGAKGELFIYDVNDVSNPFRLGTAAARSDDLECVAWNRKVAHILATGGSGGFVTVWDLKTKKASLTLNNNRKPVSAIAWDPNNSTKLLTATHDDTNPLIFLWDLRNSNAPERTLQGHEQGVLSLSWCQQDSDLLISCGKDNRTLIWNPQTGDRYGEFPEVTNWTFLTRFNPSNPNLSATAGFDGKITIQTLQNTNPSNTQATTQNNLDGEDFFTSAQTQPQGASFSLNKAPKWFERPIGATFGFGGKLVIFKQNAQQRTSKLSISQFAVDSSVSSATEKFEEALQSGDIVGLCETRKEQAKTEEEKADWLVMETLTAENPRKRIIEYLGFDEKEVANGVSKDEEEKSEEPAEEKKEDTKDEDNLWGDGEGEGEDFLSNLSANKGAKTDSPFHLLADTDTAVEKSITKALMLGDFTKATEISLKEERWADAFLIANCGGQQLVDKVQSAYLASKSGVPSYIRLLGSVIAKNLWDVVYNADLENWKETMAILCTFSDPKEFPDLCEALGDRILESGSRKDASFCYLVGSKLEKVVSIWIKELEEAEQAGVQEPSDDSTFSVHARSLQHFIEKVTIFRQVTKFEDSGKTQAADWKLSALYEKYTEYADIIAAHGQLAVAQKYLDLLPDSYPAADLARNRLRLATQRSGVSQGAPKAATAAAARRPGQPPAVTNPRATPAYQPTVPAPAPGGSNLYAPAGPSLISPPAPGAASNPYAPTSSVGFTPTPAAGFTPAATHSPYAPGQGYQPPAAQPYQAPSYGPPPTNFGAPPNNFGATPPPPRNSTPTSSFRPKESWNDVPLVARAPPPRRTTPNVAPITSPFPGQVNQASAPPQSPYGRTGSTPPPPPPKGPAPPRVTSPLAGPPQAFQAPPRPTSAASNAYAPPPPQAGAPLSSMPPPMARGPSPYNPPPSGAPPSNRYAPAPSAQPQTSQPPLGSAPPPGNQQPPRNPYAPPPQVGAGAPQSQYAPSPYAAPAAASAPPPAASRPPTGPPPAGGPPPAARSEATPPPPKAAPPPKARHPAGDRSHIPAHAQRLVDVLNSDMQRVASRAPASFAAQVKDTQKRLNLLFDHLNNEELVKPDTIDQLSALAEAIDQKNYDIAQKIQVDIQKEKTEECGNWMVGVKRLISMSKATP
ncbi:WD domain-containing protein [Colletotrichum truncatum]|uniref:WD domain-containing protein n=1 Tax=Colletotrichum truncatum TaxID=5467 RepID=A0ACC3ZAI3_COLTU|nr:WD domain-containing protein [Colletotrichum truncatum]KAF6796115.1 WD domain-containing protein [Colletotrichum truncatum]